MALTAFTSYKDSKPNIPSNLKVIKDVLNLMINKYKQTFVQNFFTLLSFKTSIA